MIKTLNKVGVEGTYLNIIKSIYEKPTANIILNGEKQSFSPKVRKKTRMSTFIQQSTGNPSHSSQTKRNKSIQIGKKEVKLSLFTDDMILYKENPKDSTKKLINEQ